MQFAPSLMGIQKINVADFGNRWNAAVAKWEPSCDQNRHETTGSSGQAIWLVGLECAQISTKALIATIKIWLRRIHGNGRFVAYLPELDVETVALLIQNWSICFFYRLVLIFLKLLDTEWFYFYF